MSKSRRSFVGKTLQNFRKLWRRRQASRPGERAGGRHDKTFSPRLEFLEARQMFNADPGYDFTNASVHIHANLSVLINGDQIVIPKGLGNTLPNSADNGKIHTHDFSGRMHIHPGAGRTSFVTLGEFFNNWRTDTVVGNANATLSDTSLFGNNNSATHIVKMYSNGVLLNNDTEVFANYKIHDGDNLVLSFEPIASTNFPSFDPIANQTVLVGAPSLIGIDGFDPNGGPLTFEVSVGNSSLLSATLQPTTNKSMKVTVENFGVMTFHLFDNLVPNITNHLKTLISQGDFNDSASRAVSFYRIANSGPAQNQDFVIQGGPTYATGLSNLGRFDDQYHFDLQHTSAGLLSMAKSTDDTNDAQFFVTGDQTRFLDFNHGVFGVLTDGEEVRKAIQDSRQTGDGAPPSPIKITSTEVIDDRENAALMLKATPGATGTTTLTVTVRDAQNNAFTQTFTVTLAADTSNSVPFLSPVQNVTGQVGQPINLQLAGNDVEGDTLVFSAEKPQGNTVNYTLNTNPQTGQVTITPPAGFTGSFQVLARVSGNNNPNTVDPFDSQLVNVTVASTGAAPTVDLADASDSGASNSDNVTRASSLDFVVTNVTAGSTVKLLKGTTILGQGVVQSGQTSITIQVANPVAALGQGTSAITATQTPSGGSEGPASAVLNVVYDTTVPAAITSTAPTLAHVGFNLAYDAQHPEEGTPNFRYSLTSAPTGATINNTTGVVTWLPVAVQVGNQTFTIVATDAAGNAVNQAVSLAVVDPKVEFTFTLTRPDGSPLTSLAIGQDFVLHVFTRDMRPLSGSNARGVFAAYLDVLFDSTNAAIIDPRTNTPLTSGSFDMLSLTTAQEDTLFGANYTAARSGTFTPGSIDELGAIAGLSPLGSSEVEVAKITLRATAPGTLTFTANDAEVGVHDIVTYSGQSESSAVAENETHYGSASVTIAGTFNAVNDTFTAQEDSTANSFDPRTNDASIGGATNTLTITGTGTTSDGGTVTITQNGTRVNYVPAANFVGADSFTYTVRNQNNEEHTATATVNVSDVNDAPVATADTRSVQRNSTANVIDVLANDNDGVDTGETLRVTQFGTGSAGGTITIGTNGANIVYTPAANFSGTESFSYTISDRATGGLTASGTVTVNVSGLAANNDAVSFTEDSTGNSINPLANDAADPQVPNSVLTVTAIGTRSGGGTATITDNGTRITYTPAANFQGIESFTYTLSDGQGNNATATISVTVTNVNDPPTGVADTVTAFRNTTTTFNVLANDTSAPDPTEVLTIDTASLVQPSNGTVTVVENGTRISYTPLNNVVGATSFTYRVRDAGGQLSAPVTVNVTVQDFVPGSLAGFAYFDVNNNGVFDSGESPMAGVTITLTGTATSGGTTNVNQTIRTGDDGSYKFENIAPGNYTLAQSQPLFTIDGRDTAGSQGGTTTNDRIVISNFASGTSGTGNNFGERGRVAAAISVRDFFSSNSRNYAIAAFDNAGASLWHTMQGPAWDSLTSETFSLVNNKAQIRVQANNAQQQPVFSQNPTSGNGVRQLTSSGTNTIYRVPAPPKIKFNSGTPGAAPVAVNDTFSTTPGTALDVTAANGVLKNDTDAENSTLTASVVGTTTRGSLTLNANGSFRYTPNSGFTGNDSFTYRASDSVNLSGLATVTINVTTTNGAPAGVADTFNATEDTVLTVTAANGVLKNDTDPQQGTTLTAAIAAQAAKGTVSLAADGSFTYTPQANAFGADSFTYRASDGTSQSEITTVTITVAAVNDSPVVSNDTFFPKTNTAFTQPTPGVLANDSDADTAASALTVTALTQPANGSLTLNANGSFTYTPSTGFTGNDSFTYRVNDGAGGTADGTVTLTVNPNTAPVATANTYTTTEDTALTTTTANGVLSNDTDANNDPLTAQLVTGPANGTLSLAANGTFAYTPASNFTGADSFTYRANDGTTTSNLATTTITVSTSNDAPNALNDNFTASPGTALTVTAANGLLKNDTDPDGAGTLTAVIGTQPGSGTLSLASDGGFTYTPAAGFKGTVTFTYRAKDAQNAESALATVTIVVNSTPVALADNYQTGEDTPLIVTTSNDVLTNDTDADQDNLSAQVQDSPAHGTLTLAADGSFTYTPALNFSGTDSFTYIAKDGLADSPKATVTITVNPLNDVPTAVADTFSTGQNTELLVTAANGVLKNDTDVDSPASALSAAFVAGPANGTLTLSADGSFRYNPANNFTGNDSFTYRTGDGTGQSTPATVSINVNTSPTAASDSYNASEDTVLTVAAANGLLLNDTDPNTGDTLTVELATGPANGTLSLAANGGFSYTPVNNFVGTDSFTYRATDGISDSAPATVTITVAAVNDAPVAVADTYFVAIGDSLTVDQADGVLDNDTDQENNTLTAVDFTQPAIGTVSMNANGSFTYNPTSTFHGTVSFTYKANDGNSSSATAAIVTIVVNTPPEAANDTYAATEDAPLTVTAATGVLDNDHDDDTDPITAELVAGPASGTLSLSANGSFVYTPVANFSGAVSFTYVANDGFEDSPPATVTINVAAVDDNPTAVADSYTTNEDTALTVNTAAGVRNNDSDIDGDALTVAIGTQPAHGTVTLAADGSFTYTPAANHHGADSFTYSLSDGAGPTALATVSLTVTSVNDPIVGVADTHTMDEDGTLTIAAAGVLTNDTNGDGQTLTATIVGQVLHGTLSLNANGGFVYSPDDDFHGTDSFTYQATDGTDVSGTTTVTITINSVNDAPLAGADSYSLDKSVSPTLNVTTALGVLLNDDDVDGDELDAVSVAQPGNGTVTMNLDGSFSYTPNPTFTGTDSFTYSATDGTLSTPATVIITVTNGTGEGGTGEGEGAAAAALMAWLAGEEENGVLGDDDSPVDGSWEDAVDAAMAQLGG